MCWAIEVNKKVQKEGALNGEHVLFFRPTPGTISCPICLDSYCEVTFHTSVAHLDGWLNSAPWSDCWCLQIVDSGRLVVSTKCGHVFCSQCLRDALTSSRTCPTCRKRLTHREYHPLYVWQHHTGECVLRFMGFFCFHYSENWLCWRIINQCILWIRADIVYFLYFLTNLFCTNKSFGVWVV